MDTQFREGDTVRHTITGEIFTIDDMSQSFMAINSLYLPVKENEKIYREDFLKKIPKSYWYGYDD